MLFFAFKEGTDGNVLAATAKQVSKSTIQLVLACQVNITDILSDIFNSSVISGNEQCKSFFTKEMDRICIFYTPIPITNMVHAGS